MKCDTACKEFEIRDCENICLKMYRKVDVGESCCIETCKKVDEYGNPCIHCSLFED